MSKKTKKKVNRIKQGTCASGGDVVSSQIEKIGPPALKRIDMLLLMLVLAACLFASFYNLGDTHMAHTAWVGEDGREAVFDLGEVTPVDSLQTFVARATLGDTISVYTSNDKVEWELQSEAVLKKSNLLVWCDILLGLEARYIKIAVSAFESIMLHEVAIWNYDGEMVLPEIEQDIEVLFDEVEVVPYLQSYMNSSVFDEVYYASSAYEMQNGLMISEYTHPPLGKNIIALFTLVFGLSPFTWRMACALFGVLLVFLVYIFARELFKSNNWALFSSILIASDFMRVMFSRIASLETIQTCFIVASYYFMFRFTERVRRKNYENMYLNLLLSGVFIGCAISTKLQGVFAAVGLAVLFFHAWFSMKKDSPTKAVNVFVSCFAFFIAIPIVIYIISYIPVLIVQGEGLDYIIRNQERMIEHHVSAYDIFHSPWWLWPTAMGSMVFHASATAEGLIRYITCTGNPVIWWFGIPVTGLSIYRAIKKRDYCSFYLLVGYAVLWVTWGVIPRTSYIYHYFPCVPFVVLLITNFFVSIEKKKNGVTFAYVYAGLAVALFLLHYPILSGIPIAEKFHMTFFSWIGKLSAL